MLDLPLFPLAEIFQEVLLIDVIHPWLVRKIAKTIPNVTLQSLDLTGVGQNLNHHLISLVEMK